MAPVSTLSGEVPRDWRLLAELDESESYEVDVSEIYLRPDGRVVLATATGCSCWGGEYDAEDFATLDELEASIYGEAADERRYTPSFKAGRELVAEARTALEARA